MTNLNELKLVIAGVGGQGTILASSIIALSAIKAGGILKICRQKKLKL